METTKTMIIRFANHILRKDIPLFRGAVINSLNEKNILFHNHTDNGFRYSYPLIQYKRLNGKAAIVCIGKGTDAIGEMFNNQNINYYIDGENYKAEISDIRAYQTTIACEDILFHYKLSQWLPLNSTNYNIFLSTESLNRRIEMLERILIGNIMSFLKGLDMHINDHIKVCITDISKQGLAQYKKVSLMSFNISFTCNLRMPIHIGLGKGASVGFGVLNFNRNNQA